MPNRLYNLETIEVSLVPKGANKKTFLLKKEDDGAQVMDELLKKIMAHKIEKEADLDKVIKDMGMEQYGEMIKAMIKMLDSSGMPPEVKSGLMSVMQQFGYMPAPEAPVTPEAPAAPAAPAIQKEDTVEKVAILKADGTLDLEKIPENMRESVQKMFDEQKDAVAKALESEKRANDAEEIVKVEKEAKLNKEFVTKAEGFKHLPIKADEFGPVMKTLSEKAPEEFKKIETLLASVNELIEKGGAFNELGTDKGDNAGDSYSKIEKAAIALVAKSEGKLTKEQAIAEYCSTDEGRQLYNQYTNEKGAK